MNKYTLPPKQTNEVTKQPTRRPPTPEQMRTSVSAMPALYIEHSVTADMADGQPLPPLIENGVVWHLVRRAGGRTAWRRISLAAHR